MKRRLYYLFPDAPHAKTLQQELSALAIPQLSVHAVVKNETKFSEKTDIHALAESDRDYFLEWVLWRINLAVFLLALLTFIGMLVLSPSVYVVLPLLLMVISIVAGAVFSLRMPNVHWGEFAPAIRHGEILMMVDVPQTEMAKVDHYIHRSHPEAVSGGVCWAA
jgi:hypothetical protein